MSSCICCYYQLYLDGQGRSRTADTLIFSQVLYQLSYLALHNFTAPSFYLASQAGIEL
jgi:hypothetical protein